MNLTLHVRKPKSSMGIRKNIMSHNYYFVSNLLFFPVPDIQPLPHFQHCFVLHVALVDQRPSIKFILFLLNPTQTCSFPSSQSLCPTLSALGAEDVRDGCINNAALPGNQTRCSGVLCRILKRYLFVHGCPPPLPHPPPLLLHTAFSSLSLIAATAASVVQMCTSICRVWTVK